MSSSSPGTIKVVCGWLNATLCVKDLSNGSSRCVHLGSPAEILTPCEFERRAGRGATKNWKKSIRFRDKPLSEFLESYTNSVGKKCFNFVAPSDVPGCSPPPNTAPRVDNDANPVTSPDAGSGSCASDLNASRVSFCTLYLIFCQHFSD